MMALRSSKVTLVMSHGELEDLNGTENEGDGTDVLEDLASAK